MKLVTVYCFLLLTGFIYAQENSTGQADTTAEKPKSFWDKLSENVTVSGEMGANGELYSISGKEKDAREVPAECTSDLLSVFTIKLHSVSIYFFQQKEAAPGRILIQSVFRLNGSGVNSTPEISQCRFHNFLLPM